MRKTTCICGAAVAFGCVAGQRLPTQKERVKAVEPFVRTMLASPSGSRVRFAFAENGTNWTHANDADCRFVPSDRVYLDSGETFVPPAPYRATLILGVNE